jgi:hypothetical protein
MQLCGIAGIVQFAKRGRLNCSPQVATRGSSKVQEQLSPTWIKTVRMWVLQIASL